MSNSFSPFTIFALSAALLGVPYSPCHAQTSSPTPVTHDARPPNIVFVLTDDMGYSDLNCYGGNFAPTPNIDRLAKEGVRFTHFYDNAPICSPSRAAFITGMFPARWNFTTYLDTRAKNRDCEQTDFLPTQAPALARVLKGAGFATAHFGKWHLGGGRDVTNAPPFSAYGYDEHIGTYESPEPDPNITATDWIWSPKDLVKRWDRTRYFVNHALDFLRRHKDHPCYVEIWPDDVHTPWVPNLQREAEAPHSQQERDFSGVLAEYDFQMGRLFDGLKALGLDQNTIVVFTSDNGPLPSFDHARTGGLRGSKLSLYEGGIRAPFIVRWPGHTTPGRVDERTVLEAVDLFPTLCAIAHAPLPAGVAFDGQDMTEALLNEPIAHTKTIFWEYGRKSRFFNYPFHPFDRSPHIAVREGKWKLLVNDDGSATELYNMETDSNETTNLSREQPDIAQRLRAAALAWRQALPKLPPAGINSTARAGGFQFDGKISRQVLENYLSRSICIEGLLNGRGPLNDDIRMITNCGAKYVARALCLWGAENDFLANIKRAKEEAPLVLAADPEIVLEGCVFETVGPRVSQIAIPDWVFKDLGQPVEQRNFRYEDMIYPPGQRRSMGRGQVPDESRMETQLWFYYQAASYIDLGCEGLHFGQVEIMNRNDHGNTNWSHLISLVRDYAAKHARRHMVLCNGHVPTGGLMHDGNPILDFNAFPLRIKETPEKPQQAILQAGFTDDIYGRSKGGKTFSGWTCEHLPYFVEFDNYGRSPHPGEPNMKGNFLWVWGYDEITWFALQSREYRARWLQYAWDWVRNTDTNGYLEMPGGRTASAAELHWYYANNPSDSVPTGRGDEAAIHAVWAKDTAKGLFSKLHEGL